MNFNYKLIEILDKRQINIGNVLNPKLYKEKIIETYFDSVDNLNLLKKKFDNVQKFRFSDCGHFLAEGNTIWKIDENFFFDEACKIMETSFDFNSFQASAFNNDSSKFFFIEHEIFPSWEIRIIDFSELKNESLTKVDCYVRDISTSPSNINLLLFGCEKGAIHLRDLRSSRTELIEKNINNFKSMQYNPINDNLVLVTSLNLNGVYVLDLRNQRHVRSYNVLYDNKFVISNSCYNKKGDQILINRINLSPLLFYSNDTFPSYEFDDFGFFNNCQIDLLSSNSKDCCFVGPYDEFVAIASCNNNVYIWQLPHKKSKKENCSLIKKLNSAKFVLKHLTQVDYLQYNYLNSVLGCSGRYESLKLWSPFKFNLNINSAKNCPSMSNENTEDIFLLRYPNWHANYLINNFMDYCLVSKTNLNGVNEEYLVFDFQNFTDIHVKDFSMELKKDLNVLYIKSFIQDYNDEIKYKNLVLLDKIKETIEEDLDFETRVFHKQYLSIMFEIYKIYLTISFIKKSIEYLDIQIFKIKKLRQKIVFMKHDICEWKDKLNILTKIKFILIFIIIDLKNILLNDMCYTDSVNLMKFFLKIYFESSDEVLPSNIKIFKGKNSSLLNFFTEIKFFSSKKQSKLGEKISISDLKKKKNCFHLKEI